MIEGAGGGFMLDRDATHAGPHPTASGALTRLAYARAKAAGLDAERLAGDLRCLLPRATPDDPGQDDVVGALHASAVVLPAWETLPFERVSPEVETMGRRLAVLHSLISSDTTAAATRMICM